MNTLQGHTQPSLLHTAADAHLPNPAGCCGEAEHPARHHPGTLLLLAELGPTSTPWGGLTSVLRPPELAQPLLPEAGFVEVTRAARLAEQQRQQPLKRGLSFLSRRSHRQQQTPVLR